MDTILETKIYYEDVKSNYSESWLSKNSNFEKSRLWVDLD